MLKLFNNLTVGSWFHFYDTPERKLLKLGDCSYLGPNREGDKKISPTVAIVPDPDMDKKRPSPIFTGDDAVKRG